MTETKANILKIAEKARRKEPVSPFVLALEKYISNARMKEMRSIDAERYPFDLSTMKYNLEEIEYSTRGRRNTRKKIDAREFEEIKERIDSGDAADVINVIDIINRRALASCGGIHSETDRRTRYGYVNREAHGIHDYYPIYDHPSRDNHGDLISSTSTYIGNITELMTAVFGDSSITLMMKEIEERFEKIASNARTDENLHKDASDRLYKMRNDTKDIMKITPSVVLPIQYRNELKTVRGWCDSNCEGKFSFISHEHAFVFEDSCDAAMFKLKWSV